MTTEKTSDKVTQISAYWKRKEYEYRHDKKKKKCIWFLKKNKWDFLELTFIFLFLNFNSSESVDSIILSLFWQLSIKNVFNEDIF